MTEQEDLKMQIAVLAERLVGNKEALRLQAREYERRLELLNHAHEEAKEVLSQYGSTYLTIERHDRFYTEFLEWRRHVDERLTSISASTLRYAAILAAFFTVVTLTLQLWQSFRHGI